MRAPEGIVQEMGSPSVMGWQAGHDYKSNVKFTCMATSGKQGRHAWGLQQLWH